MDLWGRKIPVHLPEEDPGVLGVALGLQELDQGLSYQDEPMTPTVAAASGNKRLVEVQAEVLEVQEVQEEVQTPLEVLAEGPKMT